MISASGSGRSAATSTAVRAGVVTSSPPGCWTRWWWGSARTATVASEVALGPRARSRRLGERSPCSRAGLDVDERQSSHASAAVWWLAIGRRAQQLLGECQLQVPGDRVRRNRGGGDVHACGESRDAPRLSGRMDHGPCDAERCDVHRGEGRRRRLPAAGAAHCPTWRRVRRMRKVVARNLWTVTHRIGAGGRIHLLPPRVGVRRPPGRPSPAEPSPPPAGRADRRRADPAVRGPRHTDRRPSADPTRVAGAPPSTDRAPNPPTDSSRPAPRARATAAAATSRPTTKVEVNCTRAWTSSSSRLTRPGPAPGRRPRARVAHPAHADQHDRRRPSARRVGWARPGRPAAPSATIGAGTTPSRPVRGPSWPPAASGTARARGTVVFNHGSVRGPHMLAWVKESQTRWVSAPITSPTHTSARSRAVASRPDSPPRKLAGIRRCAAAGATHSSGGTSHRCQTRNATSPRSRSAPNTPTRECVCAERDRRWARSRGGPGRASRSRGPRRARRSAAAEAPRRGGSR